MPKSTCCRRLAAAEVGDRPATPARALLFWSSGKDSAYALHVTRQQGELEVAGLLTTVSEADGQVAVHAVPDRLLARQAEAVDLPLMRVPLPSPCPNDVYEARLAEVLARACADGISHVVFGDLHLADIRAYRERQLAALGLTPVFPLWGRDTAGLAREMIADGLEAVLTCIDPARLAPDFAGRQFDRTLLSTLPEGVDPCGENGEFHTFCFAGPMFRAAIPVRIGAPRQGEVYVHAAVAPADA